MFQCPCERQYVTLLYPCKLVYLASCVSVRLPPLLGVLITPPVRCLLSPPFPPVSKPRPLSDLVCSCVASNMFRNNSRRPAVAWSAVDPKLPVVKLD